MALLCPLDPCVLAWSHTERAVHQSPESTGLPTLSHPVLLAGERVTVQDVSILPLARMGSGHTDPSMRLLGTASANSPDVCAQLRCGFSWAERLVTS